MSTVSSTASCNVVARTDQNKLKDARALQVLASTWHHQLCSHKGGREEKSPAICMERRDHGKNAGGTCHA